MWLLGVNTSNQVTGNKQPLFLGLNIKISEILNGINKMSRSLHVFYLKVKHIHSELPIYPEVEFLTLKIF